MHKIGFVLLYFGIFLLGLLFGASCLAVLYIKDKAKYSMSGWPLYSLYVVGAITGIMFQPLLFTVLIAVIILIIVFLIICAPIALMIIKKIFR